MVDLLKGVALKDVAHLLGVSWDTIKAIHTHHLEFHYAPPSRLGKTGAREQSATVDENGRHDHGLQNRYSSMVRLSHIYRKSRGDNQQDKGHEESGLWF